MAGHPVLLKENDPAGSRTLTYLVSNQGSALTTTQSFHLFYAEAPIIIDSAWAIYDTTQTDADNIIQAQIKIGKVQGGDRWYSPNGSSAHVTEVVSELVPVTAWTPLDLEVKQVRNDTSGPAGGLLENYAAEGQGITLYLNVAGTPAATTSILVQLRIHDVTSEAQITDTDN